MGCGSSSAAASPEHAPGEKPSNPPVVQRERSPERNHIDLPDEKEAQMVEQEEYKEEAMEPEPTMEEEAEVDDEEEECEEDANNFYAAEEDPENSDVDETDTEMNETKPEIKPETTPEPEVLQKIEPELELVVLDRDEMIEALIKGQTNVQYPLTQKIVRIFTSSTFTDTKVERNSLMEKVYPLLKEFCQQRGYEFQVVDMRWGVRDEATDDHMTSELCMRELAHCKKYSTGPNFITFLGQKYGYRPFPPKIDAREFEAIVKVTDGDDRELLNKWFSRDDNVTPAVYLLQPIRDKLPDYVNDSEPDKKKEARSAWWVDFERMQLVLREAASKALNDKQTIHKYYWAVTEDEIYNGILTTSHPETECYWFKRNIVDLQDHTADKMCRRFMDMLGGEIDQEAKDLLEKLREKDVTNKLPDENITRYDVKWTENGIDLNNAEHAEYIRRFSEDFKSTLERMITNGITARRNTELTDVLHLECVQHVQFAQERCRLFRGRNTFLDEIHKMAKQSSHPIVVCGEPGSGKTSLMAKLASAFWEENGYPVVLRFLGTTGQSTTTRELLTSLCLQITKINGEDEAVPLDLKSLKELFKQKVQDCNDLTIILDSLDQLSDNGAGLRDWIPKQLPGDVTMVISAIPGEQFKIVPALEKMLPSEAFITVPPLDGADISEIITSWLANQRRALQPAQRGLLEAACQMCRLPLYTKIAFDEALRWRSYTNVDDVILGNDVIALINALLDRVEKYHGKTLVEQALGYVTAAKAGLSSSEIEDVLSCDDVALNDVYQYHTPPLRRLPPLLWVRIQADLEGFLATSGDGGTQVTRWYHRQFKTVATQQYLSDENKKKEIYTNLADYFLGTWCGGLKKSYTDRKGNSGEADRFVAKQPFVFSREHEHEESSGEIFNTRKLNELPFCLVHAGNQERLKREALCNFTFLYYKLQSSGFDSLMDDFALAQSSGIWDSDLKTMQKALIYSKDALMKDAKQLTVEISGRIGGIDSEHLDRLTKEAMSPPFNPAFVTSLGFYQQEGVKLVNKYAGHTDKVRCFSMSPGLDKLMAVGDDYRLRIWDVESAIELESVELEEGGHDTCIWWGKGDTQALLLDSFYSWQLWDLESACLLKKWESPKTEGEYSMNNPAAIPVCTMREREAVFIINDKALTGWTVKDNSEKQVVCITLDPLKRPEQTQFYSHNQLTSHKDYLIYSRFPVTDPIIIQKLNPDFSLGESRQINVYDPKTPELYFHPIFAVTESGNLSVLSFKKPPKPGHPAQYGKPDSEANIRVYDAITGQFQRQREGIPTHAVYGTVEVIRPVLRDHVAFITQGATAETQVFMFEASSGNLMKPLTFSRTYLDNFTGTPDGKLMTMYRFENLTIQSYDVSNVSPTDAKDDAIGNPSYLTGVIRGTNRYVSYGSSNSKPEVGVWDLALRRHVRSHKIEASHFARSQWLSSTEVVSVDTNKVLFVYDMVKGKISKSYKNVVTIKYARVEPIDKETILLMGPEHKQISRFRLKSGKIEGTVTIDTDKNLYSVKIIGSGPLAVCDLSYTLADGSNDMGRNTLYIIDYKKLRHLYTWKEESLMHMSLEPLGRSYTADYEGRYLIYGSYTGVPHVFDTKTGAVKLLKNYGEYSGTNAMTWSKKHNCLVTCDSANQEYFIRKYDIDKDEDLGSFALKSNTYVTSMTPSPDGAYVALQLLQLDLMVVRVADFKIVANFHAERNIESVCFTKDNNFILISINSLNKPAQLCILDHDDITGNCDVIDGVQQEERHLQTLKEDREIYGAELITADFNNP